MLRAAAHCVLAMLWCIVALAPLGCSKSDPSDISNIRPETYLSFAPADGDTVTYRVRMNWFGWDPDGEVTHFLTQWDSLGWTETSLTDSVFAVSTDDSVAGDAHAFGFHTFEVKAIDNLGEEDLTPARVSFTAENIFPETAITAGPGTVSWPYVTFEWQGSDSDGYVAGYGYRLLRLESGGSVELESVDDLPATDNSVGFGPLCGQHRFEVWAVDDHGAADVSPAQRTFFGWCGPPQHFRIHSNVFSGFSGIWRPYPDAWDLTPIQIFDGEHLVFSWSAEGQGIKFRHAYEDTAAWSEWSRSDTLFEVTPEPGVHEVHVAVKETTGIEIHKHMRFEVLEAGLDDYVLVVDDYDQWESHPAWGLDEERDAFYGGIVSVFGDVVQWDPNEHLVQGSPTPPDVETLAEASSVVWYCDRDEAVIGEILGQYGAPYDVLGGYVRAGGNLFLSGWKTMAQVAASDYPLDLGPGEIFPGRVFIRDVLRIGFVDNSGGNANPHVPWDYGYCMHGALPTADGFALGFEPAYIDTGECPDAPGKWFPFCDPPSPNYYRCGLNVEWVTAFGGQALEILEVESFINPVYDGVPCATIYLSGTDGGNVCYMGFPLYYLQTAHAEALVRRVLTLFGEEER
jgi:hypothetical protein